jgi:hypothetical protein
VNHSATKQTSFEPLLKIPGFNSVKIPEDENSTEDSINEIEILLETEEKKP